MITQSTSTPVSGMSPLLSPRQRAVIELRANGFLNKQIAYKLGIRECTVKEHVTAALKKMQCRTVSQAILSLAQNGELN